MITNYGCRTSQRLLGGREGTYVTTSFKRFKRLSAIERRIYLDEIVAVMMDLDAPLPIGILLSDARQY
jgi:hypothetical protein